MKSWICNLGGIIHKPRSQNIVLLRSNKGEILVRGDCKQARGGSVEQLGVGVFNRIFVILLTLDSNLVEALGSKKSRCKLSSYYDQFRSELAFIVAILKEYVILCQLHLVVCIAFGLFVFVLHVYDNSR